MAIILLGKTPCLLCACALLESDDIVSFPSFLGPKHRLGKYSDGAFHRACWEQCPDHAEVDALYLKYRTIFAGRPSLSTHTWAECEAWYRKAMKEFMAEERDKG